MLVTIRGRAARNPAHHLNGERHSHCDRIRALLTRRCALCKSVCRGVSDGTSPRRRTGCAQTRSTYPSLFAHHSVPKGSPCVPPLGLIPGVQCWVGIICGAWIGRTRTAGWIRISGARRRTAGIRIRRGRRRKLIICHWDFFLTILV